MTQLRPAKRHCAAKTFRTELYDSLHASFEIRRIEDRWTEIEKHLVCGAHAVI